MRFTHKKQGKYMPKSAPKPAQQSLEIQKSIKIKRVYVMR